MQKQDDPDSKLPNPSSNRSPNDSVGVDQMPQISPYLDLVNQILADVAFSYDADISTLFRVSNDRTRLYLEAVYDSKGVVKMEGTEPYMLEWPDPVLDRRKHHGVTCWVAEHGEALFMPSLRDLRQHVAYAGRGAWDTKLFEEPEGVDDSQMGFGCFYAVPLRTGEGLPKDKVIGVFKIERRRHKPIFDDDERKAFDLAATSISRTLQMYLSTATSLRRVLSEAAHILRGRLADSNSVIEMCLQLLDQGDPKRVYDYARDHLPRAESLLRTGCRRIERVLEAYRVEQFPTDFRLEDIVAAALEAGFTDQKRCETDWKIPRETTLRLATIERYDLETVLLNLLRNADQHSKTDEPVQLCVRASEDSRIVEFEIVDHGEGVQKEIVERAQAAALSGAEEEALLVVRGGGTGLRRVFRLAAQYKWHVAHEPRNRGTRFIVQVPNEEEKRS
jgi:signal transduction histidine kinase